MMLNSVMKIQEEISKAGYQWQEHIYNDGNTNNCSVIFTKSKKPTYFIDDHCIGDFGFGRFPRDEAWLRAYMYIFHRDLYG